MSNNTGEKNEILLKAFLTRAMKKNRVFLKAPQDLKKIKCLGFGPGTFYPVWKDDYEMSLRDRDSNYLSNIFPKTKPSYKADLEINSISYSVKTSAGAFPAIINHTDRSGFLKICKRLGISIEPLDAMVEKYWFLRENNVISEDVKTTDDNFPFKQKEYLKPILKYFLFMGTGKQYSEFPADKLLEFFDPYDPSTYKVHEQESVIDEIWDELVFSIRSKGMPKHLDKVKHIEIMPWVRKADGNYKGALHVRVRS